MKSSESGVFAPEYYGRFSCIADKCRHSCCIGWEICIDDATYEKYRSIESIHRTLTECEDGVCFALREDGRCPHLEDSGLCKIILEHGEDFLSEICANHPRFFNSVADKRIEAGLGIVCEEACRMILADDTRFTLVKIGDCDSEKEFEREFDAIAQRNRIISLIEASDGDYRKAIERLKSEYALPDVSPSEAWIDRLLELEILESDWERDLRLLRENLPHMCDVGSESYDKYYLRLLKYFVYRHVSVAESSANLSARLGFAIFSVEIIRALFESGLSECDLCAKFPEALLETARRYSAEIEYSQDNTDELIFALECAI